MQPWYRQRFVDEVRRRPGWDTAQALENLYLRQYHDSRNAVVTTDLAWRALTPGAQFDAWQQRGQRPITVDLTHWEQRAAAHEAHQRAQLLVLGGVRQGAQLPSTYIEVETVPGTYQAITGGAYEYRVWSHEPLGGGLSRDVPHPLGVARDVDAVRAVVSHAPLHPPDYRVVVFTEDHALRAALREQGVLLGPRYSAELSQERRQFYTLEAKQAVAIARDHVDAIEAVWQTYSPTQQRRAYLDAGQGPEPTLWEQRVAAHTRLDRRQRMIPQASPDGELPASFVEVERGQPGAAPYAVRHWTRNWDSDLGMTRYAHQGTVPVWRVEQIVTVAHVQPATLYADDLRLRTQLQHHGLSVADTPHQAAQPPYQERAQEHKRERGLGVGE